MPSSRLFHLPPTARETAIRGRANTAAQGTLFELATTDTDDIACAGCGDIDCRCEALGLEALTLEGIQ